jgi:hypothetical protein
MNLSLEYAKCPSSVAMANKELRQRYIPAWQVNLARVAPPRTLRLSAE